MSFYSSTSEAGSGGSQVIDAAMTSAVTSLIGASNGIHALQQQVNTVPSSGINQMQAKRKQVKNACTNCQKACKKCDDARPCPRCIKYGIGDTCVNSVRKERKKGIKRGPYKRRTKDEEGGSTSSRSRKSAKATADGSNNEQQSQQSEQREGQYEAMRTPNVPYGYPSNLNQYAQPYDAAYGQYAAYHNKDQMMPPYVVNSVYQMGYPVILPGNSDAEPRKQEDDEDEEPKKDDGKRASTPAPSTSTSPATTSSPESAEDDKFHQLERLTELCTAALNHNQNGQSRSD
ncbi:hypothetical protein BJV82DRAFT_664975 [Fennellomyces sp. T-0311]|nr:hypothetical protein BJV82DRAFT_664975 [Fennellomyces sp. T-0311]